jgi:hypothetical protein
VKSEEAGEYALGLVSDGETSGFGGVGWLDLPLSHVNRMHIEKTNIDITSNEEL